nr:LOW QUALITY PROTEIN: uncharacterized protein LOC119165185 [Rhipicephalus microplus]
MSTREWLERGQKEVGRMALDCHRRVATEAVQGDIGWSSFEAREACSKIAFEACLWHLSDSRWASVKSDVAMNAWPPQASYPCGNFSDTSCLKLLNPKGSRGPTFAVSNRTEIQDQASICPFALREVSVLAELALGHLRYRLTDVPPQSNSPPDTVLGTGRAGNRHPEEKPRAHRLALEAWTTLVRFPLHQVSKETMRVVVFHLRSRGPRRNEAVSRDLPLMLHLSCLFTESD